MKRITSATVFRLRRELLEPKPNSSICGGISSSGSEKPSALMSTQLSRKSYMPTLSSIEKTSTTLGVTMTAESRGKWIKN